jgi:DNA-cytosine methyltransferase
MQMTEKFTVLDLCSGVGGISLGLEWTGRFKTIAFCEIDTVLHYWLKRNWPNTPIYNDLKSLTGQQLRDELGHIDIFSFGFPCQDVSHAGRGEGIGTQEAPTERSGLIYDIIRLIDQYRPTWILAENVAALKGRGYDAIRSELERIGYTCWPHVVSSANLAASHRRDRCWIIGTSRVADAMRSGRNLNAEFTEKLQRERETVGRIQLPEVSDVRSGEGLVADTNGDGLTAPRGTVEQTSERPAGASATRPNDGTVENTELPRLEESAGRDGQVGGRSCLQPAGSSDVGGNGNVEAGRDALVSQLRDEFFLTQLEEELANTESVGLQGVRSSRIEEPEVHAGEELPVRDRGGRGIRQSVAKPGFQQYDWEAPRLVPLAFLKPPVGQSAHALPGELAQLVTGRTKNPMKKLIEAQLKALGNSVDPVAAYLMGCAIVELDEIISVQLSRLQ